MTDNPTNNQEEWKEELKAIFYREFEEIGYAAIDSTFDSIEGFISRLLASETAKAVEGERERILSGIGKLHSHVFTSHHGLRKLADG